MFSYRLIKQSQSPANVITVIYFKVMVIGFKQETLDLGSVLFGTRWQGLPITLREPMLAMRFDLMSLKFTVRNFTVELSGVSLACKYLSILQKTIC